MTAMRNRAILGTVLVLLALSITGILSITGVVDAAEPAANTLVERAQDAFRRGALEDAAMAWTEAARLYERQGDAARRQSALTRLGRLQSALGRYIEAAATLKTALQIAESSGDQARAAAIAAELGNVYIAVGPPETAEANLKRALDVARRLPDQTLTATILNDLGNLKASQGKQDEAVTAYQESIMLAGGPAQRLLRARASTNAANALRQRGKGADARTLLDRAVDDLRMLGHSHETAFALVGAGVAYRDLRSVLSAERDMLLLRAGTVINEAAVQADTLGDRRTASYAWGYLGGLYEEEGRHAEALDLTRRALFAAQQVNAPESLYRWQWQAGRLLRALGRTNEAIESYRRAVYTLQSIRPELSVGYGVLTSFRETIGPVYFELVDLLLQRARAEQRPEDVAPLLVEARETVELFKAAELRDYFRDDCVDTTLAKVTKLDVVSQTAVVIYPILLTDRIELLISLPTGLKSVVVPVRLETVTREVRELRRKLEKRTTREYLPHARRLYDWLIRPIEPDLAQTKVEALVFVPDGALRTIPMAALHDGKQFLVTKYATAITPGLNLTDPRPIQRDKIKMLAVGVAESVQGFPPLPNVVGELEALKGLFASHNLLNQQFVVSSFAKELREEPYTILHVASHGVFEGDPSKTFLLAFDEKLTMDRLDQLIGLFKYREEPLELLTLSACESAAGDDRAALGLAGIAIKAGARSAVATFWQVHDQVAAELIIQFYRELQSPSVSRAVALQRAQLKVLEDPRYDHPGFWAPFLMINSWL
jgi:CHAT domain-containing protein/Tfp pilus assembly protein PilF